MFFSSGQNLSDLLLITFLYVKLYWSYFLMSPKSGNKMVNFVQPEISLAEL